MRRLFVALFILALSPVFIASSSYAAGNPRYAALVMDADTGQVLFEANSRDKRYPASLTKMMTLYMVFEALERGTWTLDKKLTASKKAASQPQTNIALRPGDQLTVEQAIKALVTRSANDVAVVLAEALGKTDWNFGVMMTNKARNLGMKNTVFRNPHGLPDSRQHTTAYDMALLGIALRRDFPQYYHFFTTRSFTYKGRTYGSHNRVLDRFPGVDGIKTGYINASGFNLVSSVKREGVNMVAVVMGGVTGASRDNHMVELLKKHFPVLAERKKNPQYYAGAAAPAPQLKPVEVASNDPKSGLSSAGAAAAKPATPTVNPASQPAALSGSALDERILANARPAPSGAISFKPLSATAQTQASKTPEASLIPKAGAPIVNLSYAPVTPPVKSNTLEHQYALLDTKGAPASSAAMTGSREWGIQVGAFRSEAQARDAISNAMRMVQGELKNAYMNITSDSQQQAGIHRARLGNLSKDEAESACRKLNAMNSACFPLRIN